MDDGFGNLVGGGLGTGRIDYDSGAITLTNCPPDADFVVTGISGGALACGGNTSENVVTAIRARSTNSKRNARIQILAFD